MTSERPIFGEPPQKEAGIFFKYGREKRKTGWLFLWDKRGVLRKLLYH